MDFDIVFTDYFTVGFFISTIFSIVGICIRFIKNIVRSASDTTDDI